MKNLTLALAATLTLGLSACDAYAAGHGAPAKTMESSAGEILTNGDGMSLYTFDADGELASNCAGGCAASWPPHMAPAEAHENGDFAPVTRADGSLQWAYQGKPLYTWVGDSAPGDITGDGVGGNWHLARP